MWTGSYLILLIHVIFKTYVESSSNKSNKIWDTHWLMLFFFWEKTCLPCCDVFVAKRFIKRVQTRPYFIIIHAQQNSVLKSRSRIVMVGTGSTDYNHDQFSCLFVCLFTRSLCAETHLGLDSCDLDSIESGQDYDWVVFWVQWLTIQDGGFLITQGIVLSNNSLIIPLWFLNYSSLVWWHIVAQIEFVICS